jgi:hypothetical protein
MIGSKQEDECKREGAKLEQRSSKTEPARVCRRDLRGGENSKPGRGPFPVERFGCQLGRSFPFIVVTGPHESRRRTCPEILEFI